MMASNESNLLFSFGDNSCKRGSGREGGGGGRGGGGISTLTCTASELHTQYESTFHVCFILKTAGSERPKAMARNEFTSLKLLQLQHNTEGGTEC